MKPAKLARDAHGLKSLLKYHASSWVLYNANRAFGMLQGCLQKQTTLCHSESSI